MGQLEGKYIDYEFYEGAQMYSFRSIHNMIFQMRMKNHGKGVKIGQRVALSYCDELKIRRFYREPNIEGDKRCSLWNVRSLLLASSQNEDGK